MQTITATLALNTALSAWRRALGACVLLAMNSAIAQAAPSSAAAAQGVRTRTLDIWHVAVDLRFDWKTRQAHATALITLSPLAPTRRIRLDAGRLAIESIQLADGKPLRFDYDGGDRDDGLAIDLDRRYRPSESLTLRIAYRSTWANHSDPNNLWGSNGKGLRFLGPTASDARRRLQIWSSGEPGSSRYWLPGFDDPAELRTAELTATVPRPLQVLAGGKLVSVRDNADGTRTFHWRIDTPHASHRTLFAVGEYRNHALAHEGIALDNHGYPDEMDGVRASVPRLPDMLGFFSALTGRKLSLSRYAQVFVQDLPWGQVSPGLALQTENMVDDEGTHDDFKYLWNGLQAESLAQQWFGVQLSIADWSHLWLERALAHHLAGLYGEYKHGHDEFLLWYLQFGHNSYHGDWSGGNRHPLVNPRHREVPDYLGGNHPYFHGASVLHMLRKEIGDAAWRRALQHYVQQHSGRLVRSEDLRRSAEAAAGRPLGWFFEQWVAGIGHPAFELSKTYDAAAHRLTLTVKQTQQRDTKSPYPQSAFFQGHVDIDIDGRIERRWLAARAENRFEFPLAQEPKLVHFDHESAWLKELRFTKSTPELLHQFRSTSDTLGREWAMGELVRIAKDAATPAATRSEIHAALREIVERKAYWRIRFNVLQQLRNLIAPATQSEAVALDEATTAMLLKLIDEEGAWLRSAAIGFLGMTRDPKYVGVYLSHLRDRSDRVINTAAIALGKSGSAKAFEALAALPTHPSWKNQSLISALEGLRELRDPRGVAIALAALADVKSPRWTLATPVWDYRLAAANAVAALGAAERGAPPILAHFHEAMAVGEVNDIFSNVQLLVALGDPRAREVFAPLKQRFGADANAMQAVSAFEKQLEEKLAPR